MGCVQCCRNGSESSDDPDVESTPLLEKPRPTDHGATGADSKKEDIKEKPKDKKKKSRFAGFASIGAKVTKSVVPVDDDIGKVVVAGADAVQEQADADPNASMAERMAIGVKGTANIVGATGIGGDTGKIVTGTVAAGADMAKDQIAADPDASAGERLALGVKGVAKIAGATGVGGDAGKMVTDVVAVGADMTRDQIAADPDATPEERAALLIKGGANMLGATGAGGEVGKLVTDYVAAEAKDTAKALKEARKEDEEDIDS